MKNPSLTQWSSLNPGFDEFFVSPFHYCSLNFLRVAHLRNMPGSLSMAETSDSVPTQLPKNCVFLIRKSKHAKYTATHNLTLGRESICCM